MLRKLLVELLKAIDENTLLKDDIKRIFGAGETNGLEKLLPLSDKQIRSIFEQNVPESMMFIIYLYLDHKKMPQEIKTLLLMESSPTKKDRSKLYYLIDMLENDELLRRKDASEILKLTAASSPSRIKIIVRSFKGENLVKKENALEFVKVMAEAKEDYQAEAIRKFISCTSLFNEEDKLKIAKTLANSKGDGQAELALKFVFYRNISKIKDAVQIVEVIATAERFYQADNVVDIIEQSDILTKEGALEFIKVIATAKEKYPAKYAGIVAKALIQRHPKALDIVKVIANAKGEKQAWQAYTLTRSKEILKREDALDIISAVAYAKGEGQAIYSANIAEGTQVLAHKDALGIIKTIADTSDKYIACYASAVAGNPKVIVREDALEFVKAVASAKTEDAVLKVISYISKTPSEQLQISVVQQIIGVDIQSETVPALEQPSAVTEKLKVFIR